MTITKRYKQLDDMYEKLKKLGWHCDRVVKCTHSRALFIVMAKSSKDPKEGEQLVVCDRCDNGTIVTHERKYANLVAGDMGYYSTGESMVPDNEMEQLMKFFTLWAELRDAEIENKEDAE